MCNSWHRGKSFHGNFAASQTDNILVLQSKTLFETNDRTFENVVSTYGLVEIGELFQLDSGVLFEIF